MYDIQEVLKPIGPDYIGVYLSNKIQLYHLIEWALTQTGKAKVTVVTFSISEEFIRKIWHLKEQQLIAEVEVVLDFKAIQKTKKILSFSKNIFDKTFYAKTHAKITLIENDRHKITIIGSQNTTRGNREENGMVTNNVDVFQKYKMEIERIKLESVHYAIY